MSLFDYKIAVYEKKGDMYLVIDGTERKTAVKNIISLFVDNLKEELIKGEERIIGTKNEEIAKEYGIKLIKFGY